MSVVTLGPTSNPSLAWKKADVFKINDDDYDNRNRKFRREETKKRILISSLHLKASIQIQVHLWFLTLQYWRSNNYTNTGTGSNRPRQVLAYISVTINITNLMLLSILTKIWSRNRLVAFLISTTI